MNAQGPEPSVFLPRSSKEQKAVPAFPARTPPARKCPSNEYPFSAEPIHRFDFAILVTQGQYCIPHFH